MAEYIDTSINPADYIEVWEVEDAEHGKQLVMAVDDLKCLPPSDVRPVVRGRWEEVEVTWLADVEDQPDAIASMFCPECRRFANHVYHYGDPRYGMNFCPHCGARMGGDAK